MSSLDGLSSLPAVCHICLLGRVRSPYVIYASLGRARSPYVIYASLIGCCDFGARCKRKGFARPWPQSMWLYNGHLGPTFGNRLVPWLLGSLVSWFLGTIGSLIPWHKNNFTIKFKREDFQKVQGLPCPYEGGDLKSPRLRWFRLSHSFLCLGDIAYIDGYIAFVCDTHAMICMMERV